MQMNNSIARSSRSGVNAPDVTESRRPVTRRLKPRDRQWERDFE